ncbi:methyltransferase type 11 (plasmid) [Azospirillum sp. TSH58]|uniref:methyltransferase domain-containing protein n=1 Tax=Azospirillum sp. TSH58 TaxID=664962 RepID=UPI000D5FF8B2|nr:class I SAM-dependent methyltransferase [Azospirillum sp. TSH58]AWJ85430.1 methyltransferase type 11 [Azospirillum sp. TSH58]AWJ85553.1 methyltransferase type 11 [Azospirillum sp. TSH58]
MHGTADAIGRLFLEVYWRPEFRRILDVGAYDVNGSLRRHKPDGAEWVGIDLAAGPGVDTVLEDAWAYPFPDASFDVVVSTATFEHDRLFWLTFLEMCWVLKPGGFIYINAPSNGHYPAGLLALLPDAGGALEVWAQRMGHPVHLIESFIAPRIADHWNDFVLVFSTAPASPSSSPIADCIPNAYNVRAGSAGPIKHHSVETEDMRIQKIYLLKYHNIIIN